MRLAASAGHGRRSLPIAAALAGLVLCAAATAQENAAAIEDRIEAVFEVVPQNPLDLAVPLSRRALARRALERESSVEPASTGAVGPPAAHALPSQSAPADSVGSAGNLPAAATPIGSPVDQAQTATEEGAAARLPRPRPGELQVAPREANGDPLDLVARAALPEPAPPQSEPERLPAEAPPAPSPAVMAVVEPARAGPGATPSAGHGLVTAAAQPLEPGVAPPVEDAPRKDCLKPNQVADKDGDFSRNANALAGLCLTQQKFRERRRPWTIQTVDSGRAGPLWVVMHDDEAIAFDNAVAALKSYGGKFITVDTGGKRNQDGIDPNRNFSADGIGCAKLGESASPRFSGLFRDAFDPAQPLIVLHNNVGKPIPTGGLGHVAMDTVPKDMRAWRSNDPDGELAGEHSLVLLAAADPDEPAVQDWAKGLSGKGINVVVEAVTKKTADCSLSNFALLAGQRNYFNVTVDKDDGEVQRRIVDMIMSSFFTVAAR